MSFKWLEKYVQDNKAPNPEEFKFVFDKESFFFFDPESEMQDDGQ